MLNEARFIQRHKNLLQQSGYVWRKKLASRVRLNEMLVFDPFNEIQENLINPGNAKTIAEEETSLPVEGSNPFKVDFGSSFQCLFKIWEDEGVPVYSMKLLKGEKVVARWMGVTEKDFQKDFQDAMVFTI